MLVYNCQINFSSLKKWLPQTTQKIIYYLQELSESNDATHEHPFDINKTKWQLCTKSKNSRGALQLEKIANKLTEKEEPNLDDFKKLLEISHVVEIYIKAMFEKITYRSKSINLLSYKNQHNFLQRKPILGVESSADIGIKEEAHHCAQKEPKISSKNVKITFNEKTIAYINPIAKKECFISGIKTFTFEEITDSVYAIGYHNEEDKESKSYTLYEIDKKEKTIKVKYYLDQKTAQQINSINDLNTHEVQGRTVKISMIDLDKLTFIS